MSCLARFAEYLCSGGDASPRQGEDVRFLECGHHHCGPRTFPLAHTCRLRLCFKEKISEFSMATSLVVLHLLFLPRSVVSAKVHCSDVGFAHDGGSSLERGNVSWLLPNLPWGHSHGNCIASSFTLSAVIEHTDVAWRRCSRHASSHSFPSCSFCPCDSPYALIIQSLIWNIDLDGATGERRAEPRDGHAYKDDSASSSS